MTPRPLHRSRLLWLGLFTLLFLIVARFDSGSTKSTVTSGPLTLFSHRHRLIFRYDRGKPLSFTGTRSPATSDVFRDDEVFNHLGYFRTMNTDLLSSSWSVASASSYSLYWHCLALTYDWLIAIAATLFALVIAIRRHWQTRPAP